MIKKVLHNISTAFMSSEENVRKAEMYMEMHKSPGWPIHQGLMIQIGNEISLYMLSEKFTKLDKDEKDAQQRAFYIAKEIIDFLVDPLKGARKYAAIKQHNIKMGATGKKQPKGS